MGDYHNKKKGLIPESIQREYVGMTVMELRERSALLNLPTTGTKNDLLNRLRSLRICPNLSMGKSIENENGKKGLIPESTPPTFSDYVGMTVLELRERLAQVNLPTTGTKNDLLNRLLSLWKFSILSTSKSSEKCNPNPLTKKLCQKLTDIDKVKENDVKSADSSPSLILDPDKIRKRHVEKQKFEKGETCSRKKARKSKHYLDFSKMEENRAQGFHIGNYVLVTDRSYFDLLFPSIVGFGKGTLSRSRPIFGTAALETEGGRMGRDFNKLNKLTANNHVVDDGRDKDPCDDFRNEENLCLSLWEAYFAAFEIGVLEIFCLSLNLDNSSGGSEGVELEKMDDPDRCWQSFCKNYYSFPYKYLAYHKYRYAGWAPKCGVKFGTDFLLYRQQTARRGSGYRHNHSEFAINVIIVDENKVEDSKENDTKGPAEDDMTKNARNIEGEGGHIGTDINSNSSSDESESPIASSWASLQGRVRMTRNAKKRMVLCEIRRKSQHDINESFESAKQALVVSEVLLDRFYLN